MKALLFIIIHLTTSSFQFLKLPESLSEGPEPVPEIQAKTRTTVLKLTNVGFKFIHGQETRLYNGIVVIQERDDLQKGVRNTSLYAYLVPPSEMVLFPKNYTTLRMEGFDLNKTKQNMTGADYFGPVNCSYFTFDKNFQFNDTKMTQISGKWLNDSQNVKLRNFTMEACLDPFTCTTHFAPTNGQVEDITGKGFLGYKTLAFLTGPVCAITLFLLFFSKDIRRVPGHTMVWIGANSLIFMSIAVNKGGEMGFSSSYDSAYFFSFISFFSFIRGFARLKTKAKDEMSLSKQKCVPFMVTLYYFLALILYPLTKNGGTILMCFGPWILAIENRARSKNRTNALMALLLMTMLQFNWLYVFHYEYNSARLPVSVNVGAYGGLIAVISDLGCLGLILATETIPVDPEWKTIDTGRYKMHDLIDDDSIDFGGHKKNNSINDDRDNFGSTGMETKHSFDTDGKKISIGEDNVIL